MGTVDASGSYLGQASGSYLGQAYGNDATFTITAGAAGMISTTTGYNIPQPMIMPFAEEVILHHRGTGAQTVNDNKLKLVREAIEERIKLEGFIRTNEFSTDAIEHVPLIDYHRILVKCAARVCLRSLDGGTKCKTCKSKRRLKCLTE